MGEDKKKAITIDRDAVWRVLAALDRDKARCLEKARIEKYGRSCMLSQASQLGLLYQNIMDQLFPEEEV